MSNESSDEEFSDCEDEEDFLAQRTKWNEKPAEEKDTLATNKYGLVDPEHFMIRRTFNTRGFVKKYPPKVLGSRKKTVYSTVAKYAKHGTASDTVVVTKVDVATFPINAGMGASFVWHDPERKAKEVKLIGSFNDWGKEKAAELTCVELRQENVWATVLELEDDEYQYAFVVDGKEVVDENKKIVDREGGDGKANVIEVEEDEHEIMTHAADGPFTYTDKEPQPTDFTWHLNFAHTDLFKYYGHKGLFAQDEIQVAEHPALASVREMMLIKSQEADTKQLNTLTRQVEDNKHDTSSPTPILIRGAERHGIVDTNVMYGRKFASMKKKTDIIKAISEVEDGPTVTNLICMEAPGCIDDWGKEYKMWQLEYALRTAYTAFVSAVHESQMGLKQKQEAEGEKKEEKTEDEDDDEDDSDDDDDDELCVIIHTGNWGCGAYGNNYELMALVQIAAAYYAKVHVLVYHTFDEKGSNAFEKANNLWNLWTTGESEDDEDEHPLKWEVFCPYLFLDYLFKSKYKWGEGNRT